MSFISAETPTWLLSRRFELLLGAASVLCCLWDYGWGHMISGAAGSRFCSLRQF
jgi:hypothetical protein